MRKRHWKKKSRRRFEKVRRPRKKWEGLDLPVLYRGPSTGVYNTLMYGR